MINQKRITPGITPRAERLMIKATQSAVGCMRLLGGSLRRYDHSSPNYASHKEAEHSPQSRMCRLWHREGYGQSVTHLWHCTRRIYHHPASRLQASQA